MIVEQNLFESSLKKIGLMHVNDKSVERVNSDHYKEYIKILYLPGGYRLTVDFAVYTTQQDALFFVAPNQFLKIEEAGAAPGYLIFYNQDFYCIQIHDEEVSCNGLLYNNINNMPLVNVAPEEAAFINYLFHRMEEEFELNDTALEEMVRTYLKQLFIRSTRLWKKQHLKNTVIEQNSDLEFFRKFTLLVDAHYKHKHTVADYADLLCMAPKTITHKFKRLKLPQPNEIIKNRIVLEAKRLLVHSTMTAKEIAYDLGYEDPAYFSRLFQSKTGDSPSGFRIKYHDQPVV